MRLLALALTGLLISPSLLAAQPLYNQVSLRAEVSAEVARDRMHVTLYTEAQDKDPAKLAAEVSRILNAALEQARQAKDVSISLGNRNSYPIYEKDGQVVSGWRERAELRLESANFSSLAQLSGELMKSLKMAGLYFSISDKARQQQEDALLKEAVAAFKARAKLATEALGGSGYKLISLNLGSNSNQYQPPIMRGMMMKADRAAAAVTPEIESGTQQISVSADAVIEVQIP